MDPKVHHTDNSTTRSSGRVRSPNSTNSGRAWSTNSTHSATPRSFQLGGHGSPAGGHGDQEPRLAPEEFRLSEEGAAEAKRAVKPQWQGDADPCWQPQRWFDGRQRGSQPRCPRCARPQSRCPDPYACREPCVGCLEARDSRWDINQVHPGDICPYRAPRWKSCEIRTFHRNNPNPPVAQQAQQATQASEYPRQSNWVQPSQYWSQPQYPQMGSQIWRPTEQANEYTSALQYGFTMANDLFSMRERELEERKRELEEQKKRAEEEKKQVEEENRRLRTQHDEAERKQLIEENQRLREQLLERQRPVVEPITKPVPSIPALEIEGSANAPANKTSADFGRDSAPGPGGPQGNSTPQVHEEDNPEVIRAEQLAQERWKREQRMRQQVIEDADTRTKAEAMNTRRQKSRRIVLERMCGSGEAWTDKEVEAEVDRILKDYNRLKSSNSIVVALQEGVPLPPVSSNQPSSSRSRPTQMGVHSSGPSSDTLPSSQQVSCQPKPMQTIEELIGQFAGGKCSEDEDAEMSEAYRGRERRDDVDEDVENRKRRNDFDERDNYRYQGGERTASASRNEPKRQRNNHRSFNGKIRRAAKKWIQFGMSDGDYEALTGRAATAEVKQCALSEFTEEERVFIRQGRLQRMADASFARRGF